MNGLLIINKPKGITSRDVVNQICHLYNTKKVGHTGTLDPIASGVLVICLGKATKLVDIITAEAKEYIATIKFGIATDTLDISGKIIKEEPITKSSSLINQAILSFKKEYEQEVPLYSAVKVKGQRLYRYARNQQEPCLPKRLVKIMDINVINNTEKTVTFKTLVSKGTYIRSLIRDICQQLGVAGTMQDLIRTKQGEFKIEDAIALDQIDINKDLISIKAALPDYEQVTINKQLYAQIKDGQKVKRFFNNEQALIIYEDEAIAIYGSDQVDHTLVRPFKMFI